MKKCIKGLTRPQKWRCDPIRDLNRDGIHSQSIRQILDLFRTFNDVGTNTINLIAGLPNKSSVQIWNGSSFINYSKGSAGFSPNPPLSVAQGFFIKSATAADWVQNFAP